MRGGAARRLAAAGGARRSPGPALGTRDSLWRARDVQADLHERPDERVQPEIRAREERVGLGVARRLVAVQAPGAEEERLAVRGGVHGALVAERVVAGEQAVVLDEQVVRGGPQLSLDRRDVARAEAAQRAEDEGDGEPDRKVGMEDQRVSGGGAAGRQAQGPGMAPLASRMGRAHLHPRGERRLERRPVDVDQVRRHARHLAVRDAEADDRERAEEEERVQECVPAGGARAAPRDCRSRVHKPTIAASSACHHTEWAGPHASATAPDASRVRPLVSILILDPCERISLSRPPAPPTDERRRDWMRIVLVMTLRGTRPSTTPPQVNWRSLCVC